MKKPLFIPLLLLGACSGGNEAPEPKETAAVAPRGSAPAAAAGEATSLTGLYQSGPAGQPNQMCIIERPGEAARFGLVVWGENLHSCSGLGQAERSGDVLRLKMTGDEACTIEARITGGTISLPDAIPEGCAYYCGARARLAGAEFARAGTTAEAALQAKDLVGDPLC